MQTSAVKQERPSENRQKFGKILGNQCSAMLMQRDPHLVCFRISSFKSLENEYRGFALVYFS